MDISLPEVVFVIFFGMVTSIVCGNPPENAGAKTKSPIQQTAFFSGMTSALDFGN